MKKLSVLLLLIISVSLAFADEIVMNGSELKVNVLSNDDTQTILEYNFGSFQRSAVKIDGETYYHLGLNGEGVTIDKDAPQLPKIARSIIIPGNGLMKVNVLESEYEEFHMAVAPSKGRILRTTDPATVPYEFGSMYDQDEFYPSEIATLGNPYILRDFRGQTVSLVPFSYNPQTQVLRVYKHVILAIKNSGIDHRNVKNDRNSGYNIHFESVYANHFINFDNTTRYELVDEHGRLIVISYGAFLDAIQPYVDWKIQKGFQVDVYDVANIGNATAIENFIQDEYDNDDDLAFVQLVGDAAQVPTLSSGGGGADPKFALVDGNDPYMDIFIGRFSAENESQVETQVTRTIWYERDLASGSWLNKGLGVASNQGTGDDNEYDNQHIDVIRDNLLDYGYASVDQIYDPSASAAQVATSLNDGRGIVNYCGHGSDTSWVSSGFNNNNVNNLQNDYMLPFVNSIACVNGNFTNQTCFAEAWLRATNNGNPTGAIVMFASSINQSWDPPMAAQDESSDMITGDNNYAGTPDVMTTIGGLWFNGESEMLDIYNDTAMSETWHIFGDASLQFRTKEPQAMTINHLPNLLIGETSFAVNTGVEDAMVCLSNDGIIYGSGYTNSSGIANLELAVAPDQPMDLTLTVTAYNKITSVETIQVIAPEGPYLVVSDYSVTAGDDDVIEFGETVHVSVTLQNVGVDSASNIEMAIDENDSYITITDDTEGFGNIAAGSSVSMDDAFSFTVGNDIPDNYSFELTTAITATEDVWYNSMNFVGYAPVISISTVDVNDDDNNMLDPGDRADIIVTIVNEGGAKAHNLEGILSTDSGLISFNEDTDTAAMIEAGGSVELTFDIDVDSSAQTGDVADFSLAVSADNDLTAAEDFSLSIGLIMEDFESGDFYDFPWELGGNGEWIISSDAYEGDYSANSGDVNHNQGSELSVQLVVTQDDQILFYKKVSSENNYDYLRFFIDDQEQESWSGDVDWSESSYNVTAGEHVFKWIYDKDGSVDGGDDCAWIDYIIFPPSIVPQPAELECDVTEYDVQLAPGTTHSETFTLSNVGDLELDYSISIQNTTEDSRDLTGSTVSCTAEGFTPGETTTWTFEVYCNSSDNEWIKDLWIEFPAGINVISSTDLVGGSGNIPTDGTTGDGITLHWGGSGYMSNGQTATTDVSVSISSGFYGNAILPWTVHGDEWGSDPHEISGEMEIESLGEPLTWIVINTNSGTLEGNSSDEIEVLFDANDMDEGIYTANIVIQQSAGEDIIIPVTLEVNNDVVNGNEILPAATELTGNYPNPFNPSTTIQFATKESGHVTLEIYNVKGQKVKTLVDDRLDPGFHTIQWDGKDDHNQIVSSGMYFSNMKTGKYTSTKKMILMK